MESLILAVELYNRPNPVGRIHGVIMLLQHSFEMLLKAAILKKRGRIRDPGENYNYGFRKCVNIAESDLGLLNDAEAITLRTLERHRDSVTHDVLVIEEDLLYYTVQGAVTLYADVLDRVFDEALTDWLPPRSLPVSADVPGDLGGVIEKSMASVRNLLRPNTRRAAQARARLRAILNLEAALQGKEDPVTDTDIQRAVVGMRQADSWESLFPGVASIRLAPSGESEAIPIAVRITRSEGLPVRRAEPGEEAALFRPVNPFDQYPLSSIAVAEKLQITAPKARALSHHLRLGEDERYFKVLTGPSGGKHKRYSSAALKRMREVLPSVDMTKVWSEYRKAGGH